MFRSSLFALTILATSSTANAGTWTVNQTGSGAAFTSLQAALQSGQLMPNDVIIVEPGTYQAVGSLDILMPLTIMGAGSGLVTLESVDEFFGGGNAPLRVANLAAGGEVRISGVTVTSNLSGSGMLDTSLDVFKCAGLVSLSDVIGISGTGDDLLGSRPHAVTITNSVQVILDGCEFTAIGSGPFGASNAQSGVLIENSNVVINACEIRGADMSQVALIPNAFPFPFDGGAGVRAVNSSVQISGSRIYGGRGLGQATTSQATVGGDGGPGVDGIGSQLDLRGGTGNVYMGGDGGSVVVGLMTSSGSGASGAVIGLSSTGVGALDAQFVAGLDGDGVLGAPGVLVLGSYGQLLSNPASLDVAPHSAVIGGPLALALGGDPGAAYLSFFSLTQLPAMALPGIYGSVLIDPASAVLVATTTLNPAGTAVVNMGIPAVPALIGFSGIFQGLSATPQGQLSVSSPGLIAIWQ